MIDRGQSSEPPPIPIAVSAKLPDGTEIKIARYLPPESSLDLQAEHEFELRLKLQAVITMLTDA